MNRSAQVTEVDLIGTVLNALILLVVASRVDRYC